MDLLGDILKSMDKPPTISDKQKALIKSKSLITSCQAFNLHIKIPKVK